MRAVNESPFSSPTKPKTGIAGKIFVSFFFLFFLGMGLVFVGLIGRQVFSGLQTWTWTKTRCQITRSAVRATEGRRGSNGTYSLDLEYQYTFDGQNYSSTRHRLSSASFQDYGKAQRLADTYQPGSICICYVNPKAPGEAVLERSNLLFAFFILLPLIFVAVGAIGILATWRAGSSGPAVARPISERAATGAGRGVAVVFFGVFILLGLLLFVLLFVVPLSKVVAARGWTPLSCTVLSSQVRTHSGNKGNTYSVDILYSYVVKDREYKANRYDFMAGSSSGYEGKLAIVNRHWPGSRTVCYVDPGDPTQAVLEPGFTPVMWIGLVPLVFSVFGLVGLVSNSRRRRSQALAPAVSRMFGNQSAIPSFDPATANSPLLLKSAGSPPGKCIGTLLAGLFWNGIVSVFLVHIFKSAHAGFFEWFLGLFMIPFVLIGLGLIAAAAYFFLAIFNPRPHLTITPGVPRLGDSLRLEWDLKGRVEMLKDLRIFLEGREEATYTRGTRSSTDRSVFARLEVVTISAPLMMRSGTGNIVIPSALMHSFASPHNRIVWSIQVKGRIDRWPDLNQEFPLTVLPAAINQTGI